MSIDTMSQRSEVRSSEVRSRRRNLLAIPAALLIATGCASQEGRGNTVESRPEPTISMKAIVALQEASLLLANAAETSPGSQRIGTPSNAPKWGGDSLTPHHIFNRTPDKEITFSYSTTFPEGTLPDCQTWQKAAGQAMNAPFLAVQQIGRAEQDFRRLTFTCNQVGMPEVKATVGDKSTIIMGGDTTTNPQTEATAQAASILVTVADSFTPR